MYDELRTFLNDKGMTTHTFYLNEYIERIEDEGITPPNVFEVWEHINTQARLDLWFQRTRDTALDYCVPNDDGTWSCMLVEGQLEYIMRVDHMSIEFVSDGMGK